MAVHQRALAVLVATGLLGPGLALAEAPAVVPVQGYLTDGEGRPVEGELTIAFAFYAAETGGAALFSEEQQVLVEAGYFTAYVGDVEGLDLALFRDQGLLWVGVRVGEDPEASPRMQLGSVPYAGYAEHAGDAATLGGLPAEAFAALDHGHPWSELTGVPAGLADGDDDTTYSAGAGLTLSGTTFAVDPGVVQSRVTGVCPVGQSIRAIDAAGGVSCEVDDGLSYSAGTGLLLSGTTFSADPSYLQRRVGTACPVGQAIRSIAADGSVTCQTASGGGAISTSGDTYSSATLSTTTAYVFVGSAFAPPSGTTTCFVTADLEIHTSAANTTSGPFFRIAIETSGSSSEDGDYGFYPGPLPAGARATMSRSSIVGVSSASTYRFGCYLGSPGTDWSGDSAFCRATWMCW